MESRYRRMSDHTSNTLRILSDIACTRCGCVCDDLTLEVSEDGIQSFAPDCAVARPWFESLREPLPDTPAEIHGQPVQLDEAMDFAAALIGTAQAPLFGESTSTLGEVRHRSDLIVYWASDPLVTHPRHMERIVNARGIGVPEGRAGRHVVVIDTHETASSATADTFLRIDKGADFEVLWVLRALVKGVDVKVTEVGGITVDALRQLADRMKSSHYGAIFFGVSLTESATGHATVEALLRLVTDLNLFTRFIARRMRVPGDVTGADSVLCWQTGYPFSVSLSRGYPRFNPDEFSAGPMLERNEVDCVVLVGAERVNRFSQRAQDNLRSLPVIVLDPPNANWGIRADVRFHTGIYGIHRRATAYRMDEIPVPLRKVIESPLPSDDEVLTGILQRVRG